MSEDEQAWADAILADPSDAQLLVWADWLEENGGEACEGVRWLVETGKRPQHNINAALDKRSFWWSLNDNDIFRMVFMMPLGVYRRFSTSNPVLVYWDNPASINLRNALLDAARAYVRSKSLALATPP